MIFTDPPHPSTPSPTYTHTIQNGLSKHLGKCPQCKTPDP